MLHGALALRRRATAYGVPGPSDDAPLGDIYETTFPSGQRNIFRQSAQKRGDISLIKEVRLRDRYALRYTFDVFNVTNTASFDVPNAQTTQNSSYNPTPAADQSLTDFIARRVMLVMCSTRLAVRVRYRCRSSYPFEWIQFRMATSACPFCEQIYSGV